MSYTRTYAITYSIPKLRILWKRKYFLTTISMSDQRAAIDDHFLSRQHVFFLSDIQKMQKGSKMSVKQ
jgi:hypothetical protein